MKETVNQQAEIAMLILGPLLILLMTTLPLVVRLLYTSSFLPIIDFVPWIILGIPLKAASWAMGFIILAKGKSFLYLFTECFANCVLLVLSIFGYQQWGLTGLGFAFLLMYALYFLFLVFICKSNFKFQYSRVFFKIFLITALLCMTTIIFSMYMKFPDAYFSGTFIFIIISLYSLYELNKRINLKSFFLEFFKNGK